jgi:hypothetical protein
MTFFGGALQTKGCLMLSLFTVSCNDGIHFPWKSMWRTKVHLRSFFRLVGGPREDPYNGQP